MLEDLEGPQDDILDSRPPNHARELLKTLRTYMKDGRKKRSEEQ